MDDGSRRDIALGQPLVQAEPKLNVGQFALHLGQSPLPRSCILGSKQAGDLTEDSGISDRPSEALLA